MLFAGSKNSSNMASAGNGVVVNANGDGLEKGVAGEMANFSIYSIPGKEKFVQTNCSVAFEGPSKPEIKFTSKDMTVNCDWCPKLPGSYKIYVRYEGNEIKGSPFMCKVTGGEAIVEQQIKKVKVGGNALTNGRTKLTNEITIDTRATDIIGGLSVSMEGPDKPEINFKKNEKDGTMLLTYKPNIAGAYKLHLKFQQFAIPGSPFSINVK
ncbi:Filamin-A [Halotydeus destructor]|nr:Filamin-A [Halotydeus destructor]